MKNEDKRILVSIYIDEKDKYNGRLLYKEILSELFAIGVTGATVLPALAAYGGDFEIKKSHFFPWLRNRSLVIFIVEKNDFRDRIITIADRMVKGGIVTIQEVDFVRYTPNIVTSEDQRIAMSTGSSIPSSLLSELDK